MRNISKDLLDTATGSSLYCVWVPVHDAGTDTDRSVAIWLERSTTVFNSQTQKNACDFGTNFKTPAAYEKDRIEQVETEEESFILPLHDR